MPLKSLIHPTYRRQVMRTTIERPRFCDELGEARRGCSERPDVRVENESSSKLSDQLVERIWLCNLDRRLRVTGRADEHG